MPLQIGALGKFLLALTAFVRPFVGVSSHVSHEIATKREFFFALLACVRLFACVSSHVAFKMTAVWKIFIALIAFVRLLYSVATHGNLDYLKSFNLTKMFGALKISTNRLNDSD